jgi:(p)ppGpp synthase/HD superfamily hydrolase
MDIEKACVFATKAHGVQLRKYTNEPYIVHPYAVCKIVFEHGGDRAMRCAALLHDTVEDCGVTLNEINHHFGDDVMQLVFWLTQASVLCHFKGNRAARKKFDNDVFRGAPERAKLIKFADLIDNTSSIVQHDPEFAKVYLQEKKTLLAENYINHPLWYEANRAAGGF